MNSYEKLINQIDEIIKSGIGSADFMIGKIEMSIDLFKQNKPQTIKSIVAKYHKISEIELSLKTKKREIIECRQIAIYFYKKYTALSLNQIANEFTDLGHRFDHATIHAANKKVNDLIYSDKVFRNKINEIEEQIKQYYLRNNVL